MTLWATTFSADLWNESGKLLIESFVATKTPGLLVAYVEGMALPAYPNVVSHDITGHPYLLAFLEKNKAVIPRTLGGSAKAPECHCRGGPFDVHSKRHRLPCIGYWFCKNAFRWLRKPFAAKLAADTYGQNYDHLMWVDADASFLQQVPDEVVASWFPPDVGCIYLKNRRTAIETGVFGYHLKQGGQMIVDAVLARYTNGRFRSDLRWDDCIQMERGIYESGVKAKDLATGLGPRNTVIQFSPLGPYLGHDKGRHNRTKKLK